MHIALVHISVIFSLSTVSPGYTYELLCIKEKYNQFCPLMATVIYLMMWILSEGMSPPEELTITLPSIIHMYHLRKARAQ
jgi:hypothetical protein